MEDTIQEEDIKTDIQTLTFSDVQKHVVGALASASEIFSHICDKNTKTEFESIVSTMTRMVVMKNAILTSLPVPIEETLQLDDFITTHAALYMLTAGCMTESMFRAIYPQIPEDVVVSTIEQAKKERELAELSDAAATLKESLERVEAMRHT